MMFMLCISALAGALSVAAFSVGTGSLQLLLAMPLAASAYALIAGGALAVIGSRTDDAPTDELDLDVLADRLSEQLYAFSGKSVSPAVESVVAGKRSA